MKFLLNPVKFFLGVASIAWALGFIRYFNHWVYFPIFPNILDSLCVECLGLLIETREGYDQHVLSFPRHHPRLIVE